MRHDRSTQSVGVVLDLVGAQDVDVGVHLPLTVDAAVAVRLGNVLIYMHDPPTVGKFVNAFYDVAPAARQLPREHAADAVAPIEGMAEPAVVVNAFDTPRAAGQLVRVPGRPSFLRVQLGRVLFQVRDLGAYSSTTAAFREAAAQIPAAFSAADPTFRRTRALQEAAAAFPKVRARSRHAPWSAAGPGRAANPPAAPRPTRWMG